MAMTQEHRFRLPQIPGSNVEAVPWSFMVFTEQRKSELKATLKYMGNAIETQLRHYEGRFSVSPRCCLMAILALTLVEASGLQS